MNVSSVKDLLVSGKNIAVKVCKKAASVTGGIIKASPGIDKFESTLKTVIKEGEKVKGSEKVTQILRRITSSKPIKSSEIKKMLAGMSIPEQQKLFEIIGQFQEKSSNYAVSLITQFPKERIADRIMTITENVGNISSAISDNFHSVMAKIAK